MNRNHNSDLDKRTLKADCANAEVITKISSHVDHYEQITQVITYE